MKYTHVIWDFNGTVLDDVQIGIDAVNVMLRARGCEPIANVEAYRAVFDFPVKDYYARIGLDLVREDFDTVLAPEWVRLYRERESQAPLYPEVQSVSEQLRAVGLSQSILSATEHGMLCAQLRARGAERWFDEVWGNDSIHAYGKEGLAQAWRAAHPRARALVLGDTTHDYAVARAIDADCLLIASGHHSAARLRACGVPVLSSLSQCLPHLLLS
jgi:phosphoglycolate phosphatase